MSEGWSTCCRNFFDTWKGGIESINKDVLQTSNRLPTSILGKISSSRCVRPPPSSLSPSLHPRRAPLPLDPLDRTGAHPAAPLLHALSRPHQVHLPRRRPLRPVHPLDPHPHERDTHLLAQLLRRTPLRPPGADAAAGGASSTRDAPSLHHSFGGGCDEVVVLCGVRGSVAPRWVPVEHRYAHLHSHATPQRQRCSRAAVQPHPRTSCCPPARRLSHTWSHTQLSPDRILMHSLPPASWRANTTLLAGESGL